MENMANIDPAKPKQPTDMVELKTNSKFNDEPQPKQQSNPVKPNMLKLPPHYNIRMDDTIAQDGDSVNRNQQQPSNQNQTSNESTTLSNLKLSRLKSLTSSSSSGPSSSSKHRKNVESQLSTSSATAPNNPSNNPNNDIDLDDSNINQKQTKLSLNQRLLNYFSFKSSSNSTSSTMLLSCSLYFLLLFILIILLFIIAILIYYLLTLYYHTKTISIDADNCIPMRVTLCQKYDVQYAYTKLPNRFGQLDQSLINEKLTTTYSTILGIKCFTLLPLFLCSQLVPSCNSSGQVVPMCKQICKESINRCSFFLDIFDIEWPDEIDCEQLPDSNDPDICVGNRQAMELNQLANRHICKENGFRCDQTRCIPPNWKCDGYMDCNDSLDEKHCYECNDNQYYCSHNVCINRSHICDGKQDCPDGRDERQCFRLSETMGMNGGEGKLQVWNPVYNQWNEICGENWQVPEHSDQICHLLGYQQSNETRLQDDIRRFDYIDDDISSYQSFRNSDYNRHGIQGYSPSNHRIANIFNNNNPKNNEKCKDSDTIVHIKCNNFKCGRPSLFHQRKRRNTRIVGGEESYPGKWPWLVSFHGGPAEVFFCAGVLISEWWVLTAAHCIGTKNNTAGWTINLGVTRRTSSPLFVRQRQVAKLIKHPDFQMSVDYFYSDDIALVLLEKRIEFDEFLRPVCLPANSSIEVEPGTKCMVIGWGKKIHDDYADYQSAIHEVEVPIVSHMKCIEWYGKQLPYHPIPIPTTMVCAGYEQGKKDACQGDSGGPLLCNNMDQSWFVAGIVSWGINCAQPKLPGIYTNVPKYLEWIEETTAEYDHPIRISN